MPIALRDVYYLPHQPHNLISLSKIEAAGFEWTPRSCRLRIPGHVFTHSKHNGLYPWHESATAAAVRPAVPRDRADWQVLFSKFNAFMAPLTPPGAAPRSHWRELFRKAGNEICTTGFNVTDSAFDHSWAGRDNYGNPVYEDGFITRTFNKALTDFAEDPDNTRFVLIVPKWADSDWWHLTRHFTVVAEYPRDTMLFSAPGIGTYSTANLTPAGDDASPGRFLISGAPWPVVVLYKDKDTTSPADDNMLLHLRLGHPGQRQTKHIAANYQHGLDSKKASQGCDHCAVCRQAKADRRPAHPSSTPHDYYKPMQLVFSDIHGPLPASHSGQRYMIHFTCASTRYSKVYFMATRDQAATRFAEFLA